MRVICFIALDRFYCECLPKPQTGCLVVHRDGSVLDADQAALNRGVLVGMSTHEAKAILASDGRLVAWEAEQTLESEKRWLDLVSEYSDIVEPVQPHAAFLDLSDHPKPEEITKSLREALSTRLGYSARIGLAGARWVAELAAAFGDGNALKTPRRFVSSLPTDRLPIRPEDADRLRLLGYTRIGQVAGIGLETLRQQFGESAFEIARAALGGGDANVRMLYPPSSVAERFSFDTPPETEETLDHAIGLIAKKLANNLQRIDGAAECVELFLEWEDGRVLRRVRTFTKPIRSQREISNAVQLIGTKHSEVPISGIRIRLPQVLRSRRIQLGIHGERSRKEIEHSTEVAIGHVKSVFGDGAIQLASQIKEPRWKLVRRAYSAVNGWTWA